MNLQEYDDLLSNLVTPIRPLNGYGADKPWNARPYPSPLVHLPVASWNQRDRIVKMKWMGVSHFLIPIDGTGDFTRA
jgi:hypothetical protein